MTDNTLDKKLAEIELESGGTGKIYDPKLLKSLIADREKSFAQQIMEKNREIKALKSREKKMLEFWANDIAQCFKPICCQCKRLATEQTYKGELAQKNLHRPVNWGYYCKKHADEGRELEREAMYG